MAGIPTPIKNKNYTLLDYARENMDSFADAPFNEVDALIFAQFCYIDFGRLVSDVHDAKPWVSTASLNRAEEFEFMVQKTFFPASNRELLVALCASPRYRDVYINYFVDKLDVEVEQQFAAITYKLPTGEIIVAFRGTDSTMVGWKEDFNMTFLTPAPCQVSAVEYLEAVVAATKGAVYVVGHSKGGHLATYSISHASKDTQKRVISVYNLDGFGFPTDILQQQKHEGVEHKVTKIMPEGSVVGIMLESIGAVKIVKSNRLGIRQHETFSWLLNGNSFLQSESTTRNVKYMDKTLNSWINSLEPEQRKTFVDTVFSIIYAINVETVSEFVPKLIKERETIRSTIKEIDPETADCVKQVLKTFVKISFEHVFSKDVDAKKGMDIFE